MQIASFLKVLSAAIRFDLQTFSRSREAALDQPRTSRTWIPVIISDLELAE